MTMSIKGKISADSITASGKLTATSVVINGGSNLPAGGTPGQVLTRTEDGADWADAPQAVLPVASASELGGVRVGGNLAIDTDGVLSVNTTDTMEQDNTLPITSAAVFAEVGNINALLETI